MQQNAIDKTCLVTQVSFYAGVMWRRCHRCHVVQMTCYAENTSCHVMQMSYHLSYAGVMSCSAGVMLSYVGAMSCYAGVLSCRCQVVQMTCYTESTACNADVLSWNASVVSCSAGVMSCNAGVLSGRCHVMLMKCPARQISYADDIAVIYHLHNMSPWHFHKHDITLLASNINITHMWESILLCLISTNCCCRTIEYCLLLCKCKQPAECLIKLD